MTEGKDFHLGEWRSGKDLGGVGGGENVIRIYHMKKTYFQLKKKRRRAPPIR